MTNTDNSVPPTSPEPPEVKMQNSFANPPISQESVPNLPPVEPVSQMASTQFAPSNNQIPVTPYRKPFNLVKTGFMIMILVLLVVGGYVGYQQYKSNSESSEKTEEVTPTAAPGSESVPTVAMDEPETNDTKSGTPSSQTVPSPGVEIVDFAECSPGDGYSRSVAFGSTYLSVVDADKVKNLCKVDILNEVEGGYTKHTCNIPMATGALEFNVGETGSDFSAIMSYCTKSSSGI